MHLIQQKRSNRVVHALPLTFIVNRDQLFILEKPFPNFFKEKERWISVPQKGLNWNDFWSGKIPNESKWLSFNDLAPILRKKMKQWYLSHHVPPFLHDKAPLYIDNRGRMIECLTGNDLNL